MKPFKNAVIVGRFQPVHIGHMKIIDIALNVAERIVIFASSSDKSGSKRNPFDVDYRIKLLSKVYEEEINNGRIVILPLSDLTDENDLTYAWGDYVVNEANKALGENLECIIYGKDKNIFKCFSKEIVKGISEIYVDRNQLAISATMLRDYIINGDEEKFKMCTSPKIHDEYHKLRSILINVYKE